MNFNKIKSLSEEKGLTIPALAEKIGLSEAGLYQSIRNQSMKVDVLEKIALALEAPIWVFFDLDPGAQIEALQKEVGEYRESLEAIRANMPAIKKEMKDLQEKLELAYSMIEKQDKLIENYEKIQLYDEEIKKSEKVIPMIGEAVRILKGVVSGKIKIGSPEANRIHELNFEDHPVPERGKKENK